MPGITLTIIRVIRNGNMHGTVKSERVAGMVGQWKVDGWMMERELNHKMATLHLR